MRIMVPFTDGTPEGSSLWEVEVVSNGSADPEVDQSSFVLAWVRGSWQKATALAKSTRKKSKPWPLTAEDAFHYIDQTPFASTLQSHKGPSVQLGHLLSAWKWRLEQDPCVIGHKLDVIVATGVTRDGYIQKVNQVEAKLRLFDEFCKTYTYDSIAPVFITSQECLEANSNLSIPYRLFEGADSLLANQPTMVCVYDESLPDLLDALNDLAIRKKICCSNRLLCILIFLILCAFAGIVFSGDKEINPVLLNNADRLDEDNKILEKSLLGEEPAEPDNIEMPRKD